MKQNNAIQKGIAFLLLIVLMISMAPRAYFHNLLARHTDVNYCTEINNSAPHFHQQSIHCHFDDLVVGSAFIALSLDETATAATDLSHHYTFYLAGFNSMLFHVKDVRGPPYSS